MRDSFSFAVETGPRVGERFPIGPLGRAIGREAGNVATLHDPNVAPLHAGLDWHQGSLYVADLGPGAGTRMNGQTIGGVGPFRHVPATSLS